MAKRIEIKCAIKSDSLGRFDIYLLNRGEIIKKSIATFLTDTGKTEVTLEGVLQEKIEYKSKGQLGYYFGVIVKHITEALIVSGYEELNEEVVDDFLRGKYLTIRYYNEKTGQVMEHVRSISSLFKDEMSVYINKCINFANQDLKIQIPTAE